MEKLEAKSNKRIQLKKKKNTMVCVFILLNFFEAEITN
jgi:hypothetical protein